jgi:hypothetical protein
MMTLKARHTNCTEAGSNTPAELRPMPDILGTLRAEIADVAVSADRLQTSMSAVLSTAAAQDPAWLEDSQLLDLLVQRLHGLSKFVGALAASASRHWLADAAQAARVVTLSELAGSLAMPEFCASTHCSAPAGEFELFG